MTPGVDNMIVSVIKKIPMPPILSMADNFLKVSKTPKLEGPI